MTKDKIYEALQHFQRARAEANEGIALLGDLLAELDASDTYATSRRERFHVLAGGAEQKEKPDLSAGAEVGVVKFTEKEIETMPRKLKRLLVIDKKRCRLRTRKCGDDTLTYEIRLRSGGYNVTACGKTLALAKEHFLEKLRKAKPIEKNDVAGLCDIPSTFASFSRYYFETFRKEKINPTTYRVDFGRVERYLIPYFGEIPIKRITPTDCKKLLDQTLAEGKGKTATELYSQLSIIFRGAIAHGLLTINPLGIVPPVRYEQENGVALSRSEESLLFAGLTEREFAIAAALALYCGLRPNELETAKIHGDFIVARNSKRKNGKIEFKRIPICAKLRPFLVDGLPELPTPQLLRRRINVALPAHKLYDLRTTFYTRCDELGVAPPARDEFVGHSAGALTNAYRDLSDEYLLTEGAKLDLW